MIDVVMCLIIFYLLVGQLASQRVSGVSLPSTVQGTPAELSGVIVVNVVPADSPAAVPSSAALVLLGEEPVNVNDLAARLKSRAAELTAQLNVAQPEIQLRADRRLSYGSIAPVLNACRDAGLLSVRLVAQRDGSASPPGGNP